MLFDLWKAITEYFKGKPYWPAIQSLFTLLSLYLTASVLAYQYLRWQYGLEPRLSLYFRSYLFKQITVVVLTIGVIGLLFRLVSRRDAAASQPALAAAVRTYGPVFVRRLALAGLVLCAAVPLFVSLTPRRASNIRIKFFSDPGKEFDRSALVYLLYELNQQQRQWYFEVDFDVFNKYALTSAEQNACAGAYQQLCFAERVAEGKPLIAVTTEPLGEDHFWQNRGSVSVVTTADWHLYSPPGVYEYLSYSIITQSIVIHLNAQCSGLPASAMKESRIGYGNMLEFQPRRYAMKASILAAHLTPSQEELLMNCFGAQYASTTASLLSLQWLRSDRVKKNLERSFTVKLEEPVETHPEK